MNKTTVLGAVAVVLTAGGIVMIAASRAHADHSPTTTITKVVINNGKPVVVSPTAVTKFSVVITVKDASGIASMDSWIFSHAGHGFSDGSNNGTCVLTSGTTYTCTETYGLKPGSTLASNATPGAWDLEYSIISKADDSDTSPVLDDDIAFKMIKSSKLSVNASPEPVAKNSKITITGKLTRANWSTKAYAGYGGQNVKLQFKKAGASTYATVKTAKSSSSGALKTTVKATADGTWRFVYTGSSTTAAVTSVGDYVDVR